MEKITLIEKLAELEHEQWCAWAESLIKDKTTKFSDERIERWANLICTNYDNLTEKEKEQDRVWARKVLSIVHIHKKGDNYDAKKHAEVRI